MPGLRAFGQAADGTVVPALRRRPSPGRVPHVRDREGAPRRRGPVRHLPRAGRATLRSLRGGRAADLGLRVVVVPPLRPGRGLRLAGGLARAPSLLARGGEGGGGRGRQLDRRGQVASLLRRGPAPAPAGRRGARDQPRDAGRRRGDKSVEHLRALLIAAGALPETADRRVERLEGLVEDLLSGAAVNPADAKVVRAWVRWQVLPRLRRRAEAGASMTAALNRVRGDLRLVLALLAGLHDAGLGLATVTQASIDRWFAHSGHQAWRARPFLVWARARRHMASSGGRSPGAWWPTASSRQTIASQPR